MWVYDVMIVWNFARINNTPLGFDLRTISSHTHMAGLTTYLGGRVMINNVLVQLGLLNCSTY